MRVRILDSARKHLVEGAKFYEEQEPGLRDHFLDSLYAEIDSLVFYGGVRARRFGFHRSVSKRFPFAIHYLFDGETAEIHAVLDSRREPVWIRRRLKES